MAEPSGASSAGAREEPVYNASRVFAAAREHGVHVVVLHPDANGLNELATMSVPAPVKAGTIIKLGNRARRGGACDSSGS